MGETIIPGLGERQYSIAAAWRSAVADLANASFPAGEWDERFEQLAAVALEALAAWVTPEEAVARGRVIGDELVSLLRLTPSALERSLAALSAELAAVAKPERLGLLLAGIAGGYAGAIERQVLARQEAAALDLQHSQSQLAAQIADRIHAEQAQQDYLGRLQRLHQIDLAVLSATSPEAIADVSVKFVRHLIPSLCVSITLFDDNKKKWVVLGSTHPIYPTGRDLTNSMAKALETMRMGRVIYLEDLRAVPQPSAQLVELLNLGGRSILAVPLSYRDELIGSLSIILKEVRAFTEHEVAIAREIGDSVAVAIQNRRLLIAEQEAREREAIFREVAAALTLGLGLDELLHHILDQLDHVIDNDGAAIILLDETESIVVAQRGLPGRTEKIVELTRNPPPSMRAVLETGDPRIINDTHASDEWTVVAGYEYIRAWLGVPLLVKGDIIGILSVDRDTADAFTAQDLDLAVTFANQAAIAIENVRLFTRLQEHADELEARVRERTRELETLYGITATAVGNPDLGRLLQRSLELAVEAFGCPTVAIHLLAGEEAGLQPATVLETGATDLVKLLRGEPAATLLVQPLQTGAPVILTGAALPAEWAGHRGLVFAALPLRSRGRSLGIFSLLWDDPQRFAAVEEALLVTVADQIGAAVENIQLRQITRQAAIIEERERLARDIHDQVTQSIYSAGLFAEAARDSAEAANLAKVRQHTHSIQRMTNQALRELRSLLFELRTEPLARHGLVNALRERLKTVEHRAGIAGVVSARGVEHIPVAIEETFYRIAMEALNNALRHAQADRVDIALVATDGDLTMTITDNGIGFDWQTAVEQGGMGLESMQKRIGKVNGELSLTSGEPGTRVTARARLNQ